MEREHIYFRGHADGFAYLKKIHAAFTYPNSFAPQKGFVENKFLRIMSKNY